MSTRFAKIIVLLAFFAGAALPARSQPNEMPPASFNCDTATGKDAKVICATPALRREDARLGAFYLAALSANPNSQAALHLDEKHWLTTRDRMCGVNSHTQIFDQNGQVKNSLENCFFQNYRGRILYLQTLSRSFAPPDPAPEIAPGGQVVVTMPAMPPGAGYPGQTLVSINGVPAMIRGGAPITAAPTITPWQAAPPPSTPEEVRGKDHLAQAELLAIVKNTRTLYPASPGFGLPPHTDITCALADKNAFPAAMTQGQHCQPNELNTYPRSPWGLPVLVFAPWGDDQSANPSMFQVYFSLDRAYYNPCAELIKYSVGTGQDKGLARLFLGDGLPVVSVKDAIASAPACEEAAFDFAL
ncbi:MAG: hypothetical protein KGL20_03390 [Rhodospirillales bacterium]|nr:hypothetical protein [Rhodospirillales bacterium]MDE1883106.1 hypothetical protein [Rhodospirillales bacterium]MDE2458257.1 hypothetical protein [Rhodospirillales bacterium]